MKKILIFLLMVGIATGCTSNKTKDLENENDALNGNNTTNNNENLEDFESEYYEIVSFTKLKELLNDDSTKLIYFGSDSCGACLSFKPIAKKFAKEKQIPIYFALLDKFSDEEYDELDTILYFEYIPYITVYQNKEFIYQESGVHSYEQLEQLVNEYKIGE